MEGFDIQPVFILQRSFIRDGKTIRDITYRADFSVTHKDGSIEVVDVKGFKTEVYNIKRKMFLFVYQGLKFTEV